MAGATKPVEDRCRGHRLVEDSPGSKALAYPGHGDVVANLARVLATPATPVLLLPLRVGLGPTPRILAVLFGVVRTASPVQLVGPLRVRLLPPPRVFAIHLS